MGEVIAVGDDEEVKLKVGDKVLFAKYSGTEFKLDGTEYLLMECSDVLARLI
jgi:chaperonin GroES